jgi:hypothetical protein
VGVKPARFAGVVVAWQDIRCPLDEEEPGWILADILGHVEYMEECKAKDDKYIKGGAVSCH